MKPVMIYFVGAALTFLLAVMTAKNKKKKKSGKNSKGKESVVLDKALLPVLTGLCVVFAFQAFQEIVNIRQDTEKAIVDGGDVILQPESSPTNSLSPTYFESLSPAPTSTPTPTPTSTPMLTPTPIPTLTPTSTPALVPTSTPTPMPMPTPTLMPTPTPAPTPTEAAESFAVSVTHFINPVQLSSEGIDVLVTAQTSLPANRVTISASSGDKEFGPFNMYGEINNQTWSFNANFYEPGNYTVVITAYSETGQVDSASFKYSY